MYIYIYREREIYTSYHAMPHCTIRVGPGPRMKIISNISSTLGQSKEARLKPIPGAHLVASYHTISGPANTDKINAYEKHAL